MSSLDDDLARRCYAWWRAGSCPSCGCPFYAKERGQVIGEGVLICDCCARYPGRGAPPERILRDLVRGATLGGTMGV